MTCRRVFGGLSRPDFVALNQQHKQASHSEAAREMLPPTIAKLLNVPAHKSSRRLKNKAAPTGQPSRANTVLAEPEH
ncbi:hypothetical protein HPB50_027261 [Hyalomma asiaticum]|uniref:Uncharacterized protein n=1 Tax=Hyalomma asiaticum TaxID=266040 RepID=A0ACB7SRX2_HYAAI|nr:hypothetical protein HPB50_027261 [Hyalomma asiaticum]